MQCRYSGDGRYYTAEVTKVHPASPRQGGAVPIDARFWEDDKVEARTTAYTVMGGGGGEVRFFLNGDDQGVAYADLAFAGTGERFFPAASLYMGACVTLNGGPTFEYPPPEALRARPACELWVPVKRITKKSRIEARKETVNLTDIFKMGGVDHRQKKDKKAGRKRKRR